MRLMRSLLDLLLSPKAFFFYVLGGAWPVYQLLAEARGMWTPSEMSQSTLLALLALFLVGTVASGLRWLIPTADAFLRGKPMLTMIVVGLTGGAAFGVFLALMVWWTQSLNQPKQIQIFTESEKEDLTRQLKESEERSKRLEKVMLASQRLKVLQPVLESSMYDYRNHDNLERLVREKDQSLNIALQMDFLDWSSKYDDFRARRIRVLNSAGIDPEANMTVKKLELEMLARRQHVEAVVQKLTQYAHLEVPEDG